MGVNFSRRGQIVPGWRQDVLIGRGTRRSIGAAPCTGIPKPVHEVHEVHEFHEFHEFEQSRGWSESQLTV